MSAVTPIERKIEPILRLLPPPLSVWQPVNMPINSGVLSFGLVAIPVKLYPAIKDHTIRFHLLHKKCGSRVRNQLTQTEVLT